MCTPSEADHTGNNTDISFFKNVRDLTINGGSFRLNAPQTGQAAVTNYTIGTNHGPIYTYGVELDFSSVGTNGIYPRGSRALWSLFSKIRQLMWRLPASHLEVARHCAGLGRRHTTTHDLGSNVVSVVGPLFTSWFLAVTSAEVQFVVIYLLVSMVVTDILFPPMLNNTMTPSAIVTVLDALGKYHDFPWVVCRDMATFHEEFLRRSRNQPGFLFIKARSYEIQYNGYILQQGDWEAIQPFTSLFVDFIIIQGGATVKCPWCKTVTSSPEGGPDVVCTRSQCGRDFCVIDSLQTNSGDNSFVDDLRIEEVPLPEAILRVRIKYQSLGRTTTNEPESTQLGYNTQIPDGHRADNVIDDETDNVEQPDMPREIIVRSAVENNRSSSSSNPAHVLPHNYLVFDAIRWDMLDHPSAIAHHLSSRSLQESASQPPLPFIQIFFPHLPWTCKVDASNGHYATVLDVLESLYRSLRFNITQSEFQTFLAEKDRRRATRAYEERYKRLQGIAKENEKMHGMKRVDFLMGRTRFGGLSISAHQPHRWRLHLTYALTYAPSNPPTPVPRARNAVCVLPHSYLVFDAIHWILLDHPSTSIRRLSSRTLQEPASHPPIPFIQISSPHLLWTCKVDASNGHYVTVLDVLESLYRFLRSNITQSEFQTLLPKDRYRVTRAYEERYRRLQGIAKESEKMRGLKRVDFLMGRTRFRGLSATGEHPHEWGLRVT